MTPGTAPVIAVTGASGFIGRQLCDSLRSLGWEVRGLVRDTSRYPFSQGGVRLYRCDLPHVVDEEALAGATALVHCAYVTRHRDLEEARRVNELGTRRLLDLSRSRGVGRFVFISSQSAHDGAVSYYGRSKRELEKTLSPGRDLVIRPGLVLGPGAAGLFARMRETVRSSAVIPLFGGGRQPLQTVHIDDLCGAIVSAIRKGLTGTFTIAEPDPIPMKEFLGYVAARLNRRPLFLPVPMAPALVAFRTLEALRIPFPVSSENLLGLRQMRAVDTTPDLDRLGVRVRPARASLDLIFRLG